MIETSAAMPAEPAPSPGRNVVAVASGKGGVGKTWFAITLAQAMSRAGHATLLFDGDLGLANVDVQLGIGPTTDLGRVVSASLPLADAVIRLDDAGIDVIAGRSGSGGLAAMSPTQVEGLGRHLLELAPSYARVVLDLGAGIDRTVRVLAAHAGISTVVTTEEPTALTDAYAFIKVMKQQRPDADLRVVVNLASSARDGERTYTTLRKACENFLKTSPPLLGVVRRDDRVKEAIRRQSPLLQRYPNAPAAQDVEAIAGRLLEAG